MGSFQKVLGYQLEGECVLEWPFNLLTSLQEDSATDSDSGTPRAESPVEPAAPPPKPEDSPPAPPEELQSLEATASRQLIEELLSTYYTPLEVWYTRTIIDKVRPPSLSSPSSSSQLTQPLTGPPSLITRRLTIPFHNNNTRRRLLHPQSRPRTSDLYRIMYGCETYFGVVEGYHGSRLCWGNQEEVGRCVSECGECWAWRKRGEGGEGESDFFHRE